MASILLKIIVEQLNQYIRSVSEWNNIEDPVELGNIAISEFAGGAEGVLTEKLVLSLVNIAEEASLKNNTGSFQRNKQHFQAYPIVHVNLYLLFTANFKAYDTAINYLFRVIEFFQGRKIFKFKNAPISGEAPPLNDTEITIELHTLSFEQLNDLWGSLGGKQMPFVIYRARLVPVQMQKNLSREGIITEMDFNTLTSIEP